MKVCSSCHMQIIGSYLDALGQFWHPSCFRCIACGRKIEEDSFREHGGHPYHVSCHEYYYTTRCSICAEPLTGTYFINFWKDVYCEHHVKSVAIFYCFSCGRPICERITQGGVIYEDGRRMCSLCHRTSVDNTHQALSILQQVQVHLQHYKINLGPEQINVLLLGKQNLEKLANKDMILGIAHRELYSHNNKVIKQKSQNIAILYGLPKEHFAAILAHELGHVWLARYQVSDLGEVMTEGFCELIAYLWLFYQKTPLANYLLHLMEKNEDPTYGHGFQLVRKSMKQFSLPVLLNSIRDKGRLPGNR